MKTYDVIEQYIVYRQSLGEKCITTAFILRQYYNYVGKDFEFSEITEKINLDYLYGEKKEITPGWFGKHSALKGLFQWAYPRLFISTIPLPENLPKRPAYNPSYVYTHEELKRMFFVAENLSSCKKSVCTLYARCLSTFLKLTYVLGLRSHETIALKLKDLDFEQNFVSINESKFYKSRRVPFNHQVKKFLQEYLEWRKSLSMPEHKEASLFYTKKGEPETASRMRYFFKQVRTLAGIKRTDKSFHQPRIHDLRGTFAVHRLTAWYQEGLNVNDLLPFLSTFLGHDRLVHTQVYLTMTEELLSEANKKFEEYVKINTYNEE